MTQATSCMEDCINNDGCNDEHDDVQYDTCVDSCYANCGTFGIIQPESGDDRINPRGKTMIKNKRQYIENERLNKI